MSQKNIRLLISFDGTQYCGWQRQKNGPTIQGILEKKIQVITREPSTVNGAGRTDAGVHALGMVANFLTYSRMEAEVFQKALNSMLPKDIRILQSMEVSADFHARYNSTGKTYRYNFFTGTLQPPHERLYRTHTPQSFALNRVESCLEMLIGSHDFSSFEASGSRDPSRIGGRGAVRTLQTAICQKQPAQEHSYSFLFTGDGFLRHMVRNIVGTLFLVGAKRISPSQFKTILAAKDRQQAGPTAPACGLFLEKVHY
ncbi:MAG: tRNA pseudouridine(38-40) synthase TruA [Desulfobulbus sp.]|nr:MAG: tRNA pseudouridine(38-40) synthase TruA [Desulfobulbus sp.]